MHHISTTLDCQSHEERSYFNNYKYSCQSGTYPSKIEAILLNQSSHGEHFLRFNR